MLCHSPEYRVHLSLRDKALEASKMNKSESKCTWKLNCAKLVALSNRNVYTKEISLAIIFGKC